MLGMCRAAELVVLASMSDAEESGLDICLEDDPQGIVTITVCTLHFLLGDPLARWQVTKSRHHCHSPCMQLGGLTKCSIGSKLASVAC